MRGMGFYGIGVGRTIDLMHIARRFVVELNMVIYLF
jgi:hypothetical protein